MCDLGHQQSNMNYDIFTVLVKVHASIHKL
jgi:hypothetical protein